MTPIFETIVGSRTKLGVTVGDFDIRGFYIDPNIFHPLKPIRKFEWRTKEKQGGDLYDYDCWEICYAFRQILRGHNSSPLLASCLWSPVKYSSELGQELIDNRHKVLNPNLKKGTLSFCDRKANSYRRTGCSKYLYYACSDIIEAQELLLTGNVNYPLDIPEEVLLMKQGLNDDLQVYNRLRDQFSTLEVSYKPDIDWIADYTQRCYRL